MQLRANRDIKIPIKLARYTLLDVRLLVIYCSSNISQENMKSLADLVSLFLGNRNPFVL